MFDNKGVAPRCCKVAEILPVGRKWFRSVFRACEL